MLRELYVRRLAVIEDLHVSFGPGLNVLTGETGAGKSILVTAIGLALGWRATADLIRTGCADAEVDAHFELNGEQIPAVMTELSITPAPEVLVRRVIQETGRNRVFINETPVTLAGLRSLGESLLNLYGQHEAQGLMRPEMHLELLDAYAGATGERRRLADLVAEYKRLDARTKELTKKEAEREARAGYLRFVISEIAAANIKEGEDEEVAQRLKVLNNAEALSLLAYEVTQLLNDQEGSVAELAGTLRRKVGDKINLDERLAPLERALGELLDVTEDAATQARDYAGNLERDPSLRDRLEERLEALTDLKKKHGGTLTAVLRTKVDAEQELAALEQLSGEIEKTRRELEKAAAALLETANRLTSIRKKAAKKMEKEVEKELGDLDMPGTRFQAPVNRLSVGGIELGELHIDETGADQVEFLISPNVGEEPRSLIRIASGGELSRIMLAIKRVLSRHFPVPTLIFDEIDAGVGGAQAQRLGRKLREVAQEHQVLCITHLPQIAALADRHYVVTKQVQSGRTYTEVTLLDKKGQVEELARMLGGEQITDAARAAARDLLKNS